MIGKWLFLATLCLAIYLALTDLNHKPNSSETPAPAEVTTFHQGDRFLGWVRPEPAPAVEQATPPVDEPAILVTDRYLKENANQFGIRHYHKLHPVVFRSPVRTTVKYSASQDGVPLVGLEIQFVLGPDGKVAEVENRYRPVKRANLKLPRLNPLEIVKTLSPEFHWEDGDASSVPLLLFVRENSDTPEPAYALRVIDTRSPASPQQLVVRATDGKILTKSLARQELQGP